MKTRAVRLQGSTTQFFAVANEKIRILKGEGKDVIRLDIGSPDLPPPEPILQALARSAAQPNHHGYQPHNATQNLRTAWVDTYARLYGVQLDVDREVLPLVGSKEGIFHLSMALIDPGDVVLIPDPGYLTYTQGTLVCGGQPYYLRLDRQNEYLPDLTSVPDDILKRVRLLWLNYPNNPTAAIAPMAFFEQVVEFARKHDIVVCHDAAYGQITFDGYSAPSLLQVPGAAEHVIEFNTLSKSHNMAGWRVGVALGNQQVLKSLYMLKTNADSGHFLPVLDAAYEALHGDQGWLKPRNEIYRRRRDILVTYLRSMGLDAENPRASIYVWCPAPAGWSGEDFADCLLEQAHVSVAPGKVFGDFADGYVRFALTAPEARLEEAMERISRLDFSGK